MRLLWLLPLLSLVGSFALLTRALYVHRKSRLPVPALLLGLVALNVGLAFLIVPQFLELPLGLRWSTMALSAPFLAYSFRLSRRALREVQ